MKTFDKKDVFSWSNAEDARQYIGQSGYFCDCCVKNAEEWGYGKLTQIYTDNSVNETFYLNDGYSYGLFIPDEKVRKEKTYRPFRNQDEIKEYFDRKTMLGCSLSLQHKRTSERFTLTVIGTFENGLILPLYGALTWEQLFNGFDLYINGQKQPFGVEE